MINLQNFVFHYDWQNLVMDLKGWADERTKNTHRNFEFLKNENVLRIPTTKYFFGDVLLVFFE